ncbi:MAG TPA: hypothetical protein PLY93_00285 [Turneriella sp.]|nr:hypothetical protein [Turneriella sp.]
MRRLALLLFAAFLAAHCASGNKRDDSRFSYENLYQDRYQRGDGGIIPVTIDRGESYSGSISRDQKYLYFSSNTAGNYDLYLRDLADVFSIPVVSKVTNQREPTISPNGKYLAYVDDELDPDGDIMLLKVNPKKLIQNYQDKDTSYDERFTPRAENLTNSEKHRIRARDANPAWSPDGDFLAWSTDLNLKKADDLGAGAGALQNIWIMPASSPEKKRQLTTEGGVMPSFSPDSKRIVYISYQDQNSNGAVYELEIATGKTRRLTSGKALDLYPSYTPDMKAVVLTRIARDTNGDGSLDRKDAGQIIRIQPKNFESTKPFVDDESVFVEDNERVALTAENDSVFDSRVSNFIGGSIILAQVKGEDINIGFIPLSGAVPVKGDILQQEEYLTTLIRKTKNKNLPCLGFEQLPSAFTNSPDLVVYRELSFMRESACNKSAAQRLQHVLNQSGEKEKVLYRLFNDLSIISPDYADLKGVLPLPPLADTRNHAEYFSRILVKKDLWNNYNNEPIEFEKQTPVISPEAIDSKSEIKSEVESIKPKQVDPRFIAVQSFIRYEQAKVLIREGKHREAVTVIRKILQLNPTYIGLDTLFLENGILDSTSTPAPEIVFLLAEKPDAKLLPAYFSKLPIQTIPIRVAVRRKAERFLSTFYRTQFAGGNIVVQEQYLVDLPTKNYRMLHAMFALQKARAKIKEGEYDEASTEAKRTLELSTKGTINYFDGQLQLARIAEVKEGAAAAFKIHESAIANFRDTEIPQYAKLIISKNRIYHTERAAQFSRERNDRAAATEYMALLDLFLSTHAAKLTSELNSGEILETALNLDDIALRAAREEGGDEKLAKDIIQFYDSRIDLARRYLVTEFIFGRGYFRAQLGINKHSAAEREGLTKSVKKEVFVHFLKAEIDFNWSFFANARFADAYIMLGWMYQFIDEKREVVLDASSGKKDREIFESLYKAYFPDYLFEKNIRLYQKTLTIFANAASKRVKNSFHLNIANNYFLLNNYSQAEEHYAAILDKKGNPDFRFETPEQEMMFYYHFGRTLYFSGKNEVAMRYLQFVEDNLNSRYPIAGVSAEIQKTNAARRAIAYKTFALNSEYAGQVSRAIYYHRTILSEAKSISSDTPRSLSHLELARLYLKQDNYGAALWQTNNAEKELKKEKEISIPKFKIRIKWLWVYEPWTTIVGWIYKLSYDDIYIGENHLAFELPTVNRYQLLYSIRADVYKHKGLIQEASDSLAKLVEYAEKDKTKHGKETLAAAVSRRGELEFQLQNWDSAMSLYQTAFKQAEKDKNVHAAQTFRKNILLCKLRKLETGNESIASAIKTAERNAAEVQEYENDFVAARLKAERKRLKELEEGEIRELTDERATKLTLAAQQEIQSILYFKAMNLAHAAILYDFRERFEAREESFDDYLKHKKTTFDRFSSVLNYFRGYTQESTVNIDKVYEPSLKNNALRLKLAMNRAKVLQEMSLVDSAIAEIKEIEERSQEFRADLIYAIAAYRSYRIYEDAGMEENANLGQYKNLFNFFLKHQNFLRQNSDLFERISYIVIDRALKSRNYAEAIRVEDLRRQMLGLQVYFDNLKFDNTKDDHFDKLLVLEQRRYTLAKQIELERFARTNVAPLEKELVAIDNRVEQLRGQLQQADALGYHYNTFFSLGYSDNDLQSLADGGFIYALKPRNDIIYIFAKAEGGRKKEITYSTTPVEADDDAIVVLEELLQKTQAKTVVLAPEILTAAMESISVRLLDNQTTLRSAINFSKNIAEAKRNVLQFVKTSTFLGFSSSNEVRYKTNLTVDYVSKRNDFLDLKIHRNVIDYEGELVKKGVIADTASRTPAELFSVRGKPNYAVASFVARNKMNDADNFRFAAASDLYYSALGARQVLYTFASRKDSQTVIESYLNVDDAPSSALVTGASIDTSAVEEKSFERQRSYYLKQIREARQKRDYEIATSYAQDMLSFFPDNVDYQLLAAELNFIGGNNEAAKRYISMANVSEWTPLAARKSYARLLLRAGSLVEARAFIEADDAVANALRRESAEAEGLYQLSSFESGNFENLTGDFPWGRSVSPSAKTLRKKIPAGLKDSEMLNDICTAAVASLEYALVANACVSIKNATEQDKENRLQIRRWFNESQINLQIPADADNLDFLQTLSLMKSGYIGDSLDFAKKYLLRTELSVSENLLIFSLLRVFATRQANTEEIKQLAQILAQYGKNASKKAKNFQAKTFYELLSLAEDVSKKGVSALDEIAKKKTTPWSSGLQSAYNNLYFAALTVNPNDEILSVWQKTGFVADKKIESDFQFYVSTKENDEFEAINCDNASCALFIKRYLVLDENNKALKLALQSQGKANVAITSLLDGAFGYIEVFHDEVYEWFKDGQKIKFSRLKKFDEKYFTQLSRSRKYLAYTPRRNLFARHKIPVPRKAVLFDVSLSSSKNNVDFQTLSLAAPEASTLYSALYARWGSSRDKEKAAVIQIKPPFHTAVGALNIYTRNISLDDLPRLKPAAYHLFCLDTESYNSFALFAQSIVNLMVEKGLSVEDAYEVAFTKGAVNKTKIRPFYYLYRN